MENSASTAPASSIPAGTMGSPKSSPPRSVDDRRKILELETELTTMTSEFSSELENLSHKLTNAHESSLFWQQKHSSLNQTFLKTDTDLRLLRAELSSLKQTQEERDREISAQMRRLMLDRDAWRDAHNEAMKEVRVKDELVGVLRGQVRGLKSWVSASSRGGEEQVSDEVVAERWTRLGNELQNWVIIHFRRLRIGRLPCVHFFRVLPLSIICHVLWRVISWGGGRGQRYLTLFKEIRPGINANWLHRC